MISDSDLRAWKAATEMATVRLRLQMAVEQIQGLINSAAARNAELEELRKELQHLHRERIIIQEEARLLTCVYCGHEYPPGTPASNHEALSAHVGVCERHPAKRLREERDAALAENAKLRKDKERLAKWLASELDRTTESVLSILASCSKAIDAAREKKP